MPRHHPVFAWMLTPISTPEAESRRMICPSPNAPRAHPLTGRTPRAYLKDLSERAKRGSGSPLEKQTSGASESAGCSTCVQSSSTACIRIRHPRLQPNYGNASNSATVLRGCQSAVTSEYLPSRPSNTHPAMFPSTVTGHQFPPGPQVSSPLIWRVMD